MTDNKKDKKDKKGKKEKNDNKEKKDKLPLVEEVVASAISAGVLLSKPLAAVEMGGGRCKRRPASQKEKRSHITS